MRLSQSLLWCGAGVLVALAGCGGSDGPEPVPVSGLVTLDGKPLADAEITFAAEGFAGYGKTNAEGQFELVQGALPGKNAVWISKWVGSKKQFETADGEELDPTQMMMAAGADPALPNSARNANVPHETLPPQYSSPSDSKLTYDVPDDGTDAASFRLQSH